MGKVSRSNRENRSINFWLFARDVLRDAINKGQGIPYLLGIILMVIVLKMPGEDVSKLAFLILDAIINYSILGWGIAIIVLPGWYVHAKWQRRIMYDEIARIADERNSLQTKLLGSDIKSSLPGKH